MEKDIKVRKHHGPQVISEPKDLLYIAQANAQPQMRDGMDGAFR
jgi:hypothetical protein